MQVRQLVDQHVVDDPGGHPLQPLGEPDASGRPACTSPSAASGSGPSGPSRARPGRRGSGRSAPAPAPSAPRRSAVSLRSDRWTRATIVSTHSASSLRVSEAGTSTTIRSPSRYAETVRRRRLVRRTSTSARALRRPPCRESSLFAHSSSRSLRPGVDDPVRVDAGGLGALGAVPEEVELARGVGVGVDREQAAEVARQLEQLGRRVAALGPGVDLDRHVVLDAGLEDRLRVELGLLAGPAGAHHHPAGAVAEHVGARVPDGGRPSAWSCPARPSPAWSARWRPGRRAGRASPRSGRGCRRRGCRPRCP